MKISNCCHYETNDILIIKYSFCPECNEHCEYIDYEPTDDQIYNDFCHEGGIKFTKEEWQGR